MMLKEEINIIIADDNKQFIEGLKVVLKKCSRYTVIDSCTNGMELTESPYLYKADLLITDLEMPVMNGIEAVKKINYKYPRLPVIVLTMHLEKVFLQDIISAGIKGFVYKPDVSIKLIEVISQVLDNNFVFPYKLKIKN